jgi:DNA-binding GntR family transcriptional regulator
MSTPPTPGEQDASDPLAAFARSGADSVQDADKVSLVEALRDAIMTGRYAPRQRLIEVDLCEDFGAKRAAVRAALLRLEAEGLVERVPNRGSRVRVIPLAEAVEIIEVRMAVEGMCAAKAAENVTEDELAELLEIRSAMTQAVARDDYVAYSQLNRRLHVRVVQISRQETARLALKRLNAQNVRHQFHLAFTPGRAAQSLPEHLAIIDAIGARNPGAAEEAMRAHLRGVISALRATEMTRPPRAAD